LKKQVLVSVDRAETRVALLEASGTPAAPSAARTSQRKRGDGRAGAGYRIAELYIERRGSRSIVGNIYKGKVEAVLPGLEAAFVDFGLEKNGFLHVDEIVLPGVQVAKRGRGAGRQISSLLKVGQEIVVQVVKDPLKTKGARLSMEVTIAGRYMVYSPSGEGIGVSRRLDQRERERLRRATAKLDLGSGGVIVRTAAHGAARTDFERELLYLHKLNEVLESRVAETSAPALVFQEADLSVRVVRDIFSEHFERAIVDDERQYNRLVSFLTRTAPELVDRVELWGSDEDLFEAYAVDAAIEQALSRRVDLPSGGYLMIDHAEALTVIDVNSGSFIGRGKDAGLEDTITQTNLEAAEAVVNQLRLRDIGGIVVIDFIDMARARNRDAVMKTLRQALEDDRTKTFTAEISALGLVEMTRQNVTEGLRGIVGRPCPTCDGEGIIRSEETLAISFERRLRELAAAKPDVEAFLVQVNPRITAEFTGQEARMLTALEERTGKLFHFEGSDGLPLDHFAITFEGTPAEVRERAVPFRAGDEVLVEIVEPHMYIAGDAVAKIDGYLVSIAGGAAYVGEKRLVRIQAAERTAATALLLDENGEVIVAPPIPPRPAARRSASAQGTGTGTRSGSGSRGRRGGTRRRGAATAADGDLEAAAAALPADASAAGDATDGPVAKAPAPGRLSGDASAEARATATSSSDDAPGAESDAETPRAPRRRTSGTRQTRAAAVTGDVADDDDAAVPGGPQDADAAEPGADGLQSKPRRRGRRGGRRRTTAKTTVPSE
jgi:ribonuclease G